MNYYADIEIYAFNHIPKYMKWLNFSMERYAVNYAASGHIFWQNPGKKPFRVVAPVMWWQLPENHYCFGCYDGTPWDHRFVSFSGERVKDYLNTGLLPAATAKPFVQIRDPERATKAFDELLDYLAFPRYGISRTVQLLEGLMLQLHEQGYVVPPDQLYAGGVKSLCQEINEQPERKWDFQIKAKDLHLSYSRFRAVFKKLTGFAPHDYLIKSRIRKAAGLLRQSSDSVEEIAEQVGVKDFYYFSRLFKRHQGVSPNAYRKQFSLPGSI